MVFPAKTGSLEEDTEGKSPCLAGACGAGRTLRKPALHSGTPTPATELPSPRYSSCCSSDGSSPRSLVVPVRRSGFSVLLAMLKLLLHVVRREP